MKVTNTLFVLAVIVVVACADEARRKGEGRRIAPQGQRQRELKSGKGSSSGTSCAGKGKGVNSPQPPCPQPPPPAPPAPAPPATKVYKPPAVKPRSPKPKPSCRDITDVIRKDSDYSIMFDLLKAADMTDNLRESGPFTVFVPDDAAFTSAFTSSELRRLQHPDNRKEVRELIKYHTVEGKIFKKRFSDGTVETTLGEDIHVDVNGSRIILNGHSRVTRANRKACNGVVHEISEPLSLFDYGDGKKN